MFLSDGSLNYTAVIVTYESLTPDQQKLLLQLLDWDDPQQLYDYYNKSAKEANIADGPQRSLQDYVEYRIHKKLLLYVPPVLILIGVLGNLLSLVVLSRPSMRRVSAYLYLSVLSLADTLVLLVGLLRMWITELTGYDIQDSSEQACKLTSMLGTVVSDFSVWLIIAVTVERYIAVCHPLKAHRLCDRRRAVAAIIIIIQIQLCVNGHFLWTTGLSYQNTSTTSSSSSSLISSSSSNVSLAQGIVQDDCKPRPEYEWMFDVVWPWMDMLMYSFIPFSSILVLNALIIRKVIAAKRKRASLSANGNMSPSFSSVPGNKGGQSANDGGARLSGMLLTVSFAFLLMTLPMMIVLICITLRQGPRKMSPPSGAKFLLLRTASELLMYSNHSTNFFLYCATGLKFRQELQEVFGSRRRKGSSSRSNYNSGQFIALKGTAVESKAGPTAL